MSFLCPVVILFIGLGLGGGLYYASYRVRSRMQVIESAKPCQAGSPVEGLIKLHGTVKSVNPNAFLTSPIEHFRCVYYKLVIEELRQEYISSGRTKPKSAWVPIVEDSQSIPMVIADETGQINVDPREAELDFKVQRTHTNLFSDLPKDVMESLQARYKIVVSSGNILKQLRYTEVVISQNQEVFAVGECEIEDGQATLKPKEHPVLLTFRNEEQVLRTGRITTAVFKYAAIGVPALFLAFAIFAFMSMWSSSSTEHTAKRGNEEWVTKVKSMSFSERAAAAKKLATLPVVKSQIPEVAPELNGLLDSNSSSQRDAALAAIKKGWGSSVNEPALRRLQEKSTDEWVQKDVAAAFKKISKQ
jgi:E3 Ubiquitin ligase